MNSYNFRQRCRPRSDFRIPAVMDFLDLVKKAFVCSDLYDSKSKPVRLTEEALRNIFEKAAARLPSGLGANVDFFTMPPRNRARDTVRIEIHSGTHSEEIFIDTYNISMDDGSKVPDLDYFEKSVAIFKPFEAFLAEDENEHRLDAYDRQQADPGFTKPAIIRGFHYLDKGMADSVGGIKYCLKAPAWRVRKFREGVLIELVPGLFDPTNPEHLRIQEEAMTYFNLW